MTTIPEEEFVDNSQNEVTPKTGNYLTLYELSSLIFMRTAQLSAGVAPKCDYAMQVKLNFDPLRIAQYEVSNKLVTYVVARTLPNGDQDHIKSSSMFYPPT